MIFPHTITIFSKKTKSKICMIEGVYWYGEKGISLEGKGVVRSDSVTVFVPKEKAMNLTIEKGDRIVKGSVDDINSWNDLNSIVDIITVKRIDDNRIGSDIDNLVVMGE